jgi:hypothetical protein
MPSHVEDEEENKEEKSRSDDKEDSVSDDYNEEDSHWVTTLHKKQSWIYPTS